jgi:hypothetical protein
MWLTPKASSNPEAVRPRLPATPALLTSRCSGRSLARKACAHARTEPKSPRSSPIASTFEAPALLSSSSARCAFSAARQAMNTCAPCRPSSRAVTKPMPVLAPVTRATFPASAAESVPVMVSETSL